MTKEKENQPATGHRRVNKRKPARVREVLIHGSSEPLEPSTRTRLPPMVGEGSGSNGTQYERQRIRNPYVPGERQKMIEKRTKLTLKAFRIAYENHHRS